MTDPVVLAPNRQRFAGRTYTRSGDAYYRANGRRVARYLHRDVYAAAHGPIPAGFHVHHVNGDTEDNRLANLTALDPAAHGAHHGETTTPAQREARRRNAAAASAGNALIPREQRAEAAAAGWAGVTRTIVECEVCGAVIWTPFPTRTRFCGGTCRARARRAALRREVDQTPYPAG